MDAFNRILSSHKRAMENWKNVSQFNGFSQLFGRVIKYDRCEFW